MSHSILISTGCLHYKYKHHFSYSPNNPKNMSTKSASETSIQIAEQHHHPTTTPPKNHQWLLLLFYCTCFVVGGLGGPLLQRLYYMHGGTLKWFQSALPSIGFFIFLPPLFVAYFKTKLSAKLFFIDFKLFYWSVCIGVLLGLSSYLGSVGISRLPVSTFSLLSSTTLVFTALFALMIVKQKFTFYSSNAVVAITLGAIVLALHSSGDRPSGITKAKYMGGFLLTLTGVALSGLCAPLYQLAYTRSSRTIDYLIMMQVVVVVNISSALFSIVGMLVNKEFQAIPRDAKEFLLGEEKYYLIAVSSAIIWQLTFLGTTGIIKWKSSLFAGILGSGLVPITQVASVITFHEKFTEDKALSLALCIWGFTSYFIGEFKMAKKSKHIVENTLEDVKIDRKCLNQLEMIGNGDKAMVLDV